MSESMPTPRARAWRSKPVLICLLLLVASAILFTTNLEWYSVELQRGSTISVSGSDALPAVTAWSLVLLAVGAALAIARGVVRLIESVLAVVASAALIWVLVSASFGNPALPVVARQTGIDLSALGSELAQTNRDWGIWAALALAILAGIITVLILFAQRSWPQSGARFERERTAVRDTASDWDQLSRGDDPTGSSEGSSDKAG